MAQSRGDNVLLSIVLNKDAMQPPTHWLQPYFFFQVRLNDQIDGAAPPRELRPLGSPK